MAAAVVSTSHCFPPNRTERECWLIIHNETQAPWICQNSVLFNFYGFMLWNYKDSFTSTSPNIFPPSVHSLTAGISMTQTYIISSPPSEKTPNPLRESASLFSSPSANPFSPCIITLNCVWHCKKYINHTHFFPLLFSPFEPKWIFYFLLLLCVVKNSFDSLQLLLLLPLSTSSEPVVSENISLYVPPTLMQRSEPFPLLLLPGGIVCGLERAPLSDVFSNNIALKFDDAEYFLRFSKWLRFCTFLASTSSKRNSRVVKVVQSRVHFLKPVNRVQWRLYKVRGPPGSLLETLA